MDLTLIAPAIVLLVGAAGIAAMARRVMGATTELAGSRRRFDRLEQGLIPLRVETRQTRASIDRFRRQ